MSQNSGLTNEEAWDKFISMLNNKNEFGRHYTQQEMSTATGRSRSTIIKWIGKAKNGLKPSWAIERITRGN